MIFDCSFKVNALHGNDREFKGFVLTTTITYGDGGPEQEEHIFFDADKIHEMNNYMKETVDVLCEGFDEPVEDKKE